MENVSINHLAVVVAALSTFLLGGLWYSPILFGNAWQRENQLTDEKLKQANSAKIFGLSFIFSLVMAYNLAFFLGDPSVRALMGLLYGFLTGFGWVVMALAIVSLFEQKTWKYILINGGYLTLAFSLMGLILGAWK